MHQEFESEYFVTEPRCYGSTVADERIICRYRQRYAYRRTGCTERANITASMTNGTLTRKGDIWEARPSKVGTDAVISVSARMADGRSVEMAKEYVPRTCPARSDAVYRI